MPGEAEVPMEVLRGPGSPKNTKSLPTVGLEGCASSSGQTSQPPVLMTGPSKAAFPQWVPGLPHSSRAGRSAQGLAEPPCLQPGSAGHLLAVPPARLLEQHMGLALGHVQAGSPAKLGTVPPSPSHKMPLLVLLGLLREVPPQLSQLCLQLGDIALDLAQGVMQPIVLPGRARRVPAGAQPGAPGSSWVPGAAGDHCLGPCPALPG